ncbi:MAG TPA: GTPase HflX [Vicinamibacteria bacterium]|nr:GTPase HflX [Vicinamibacteria bacterium]
MPDAGEKALLVGLALGRRHRARAEESLAELALLARSAGARVVGTVLQERARRDAATLIGRGKVDEVKRVSEELEADAIFFDEDLAPAQQRNLERAVERKTLDRTQVILDIFARRARTREGRLQVELAQLDYLLPRLSGKGVLLSRLGGGIGTRGPGETKLETDRRRIRQRIQSIRREIEHVRRERLTRREARGRRESPVVAMVGYTNAGKSTLFNALTRGGAAVSDQLFVTLDPLVRRVRLGPGRDLLLVDTVGFIQKLPHSLVAAFRATLEEVKEADLLLHVVDASSPGVEEREAAVEAVLLEIGARDRPRLLVLNKTDATLPERCSALLAARPGAVAVSALLEEDLDTLLATVAEHLDLTPRRVRLSFAAADRRGVAGVYSAARVLGHEVVDGRVVLDAEISPRALERYRRHLW